YDNAKTWQFLGGSLPPHCVLSHAIKFLAAINAPARRQKPSHRWRRAMATGTGLCHTHRTRGVRYERGMRRAGIRERNNMNRRARFRDFETTTHNITM